MEGWSGDSDERGDAVHAVEFCDDGREYKEAVGRGTVVDGERGGGDWVGVDECARERVGSGERVVEWRNDADDDGTECGERGEERAIDGGVGGVSASRVGSV